MTPDFTAEELATVGRLMDRDIFSITDAFVWWPRRGGNTNHGEPIAHFAADVLTKLVKERANPNVFTEHSSTCVTLGEPCYTESRAATWPAAVLKVAAQFQMAREEREKET